MTSRWHVFPNNSSSRIESFDDKQRLACSTIQSELRPAIGYWLLTIGYLLWFYPLVCQVGSHHGWCNRNHPISLLIDLPVRLIHHSTYLIYSSQFTASASSSHLTSFHFFIFHLLISFTFSPLSPSHLFHLLTSSVYLSYLHASSLHRHIIYLLTWSDCSPHLFTPSIKVVRVAA